MPRGKRSTRAYSFPILPAKQIVKCISELGMHITLNDLKDPQEAAMRSLYMQILDKLGDDVAGSQQMKFQALNAFEHPELHEQSVGQVALVKQLIKIMNRVGVKDFSFQDVLAPTTQRTSRNLSALINFFRFREEKIKIIDQEQLEEEKLSEQLKRETQQNENLAAQLLQTRGEKQSQAEEMDEISAAVARGNREMNEKLVKKQENDEWKKKIDKELGELGRDLAEARSRLNNVKSEEQRLDSQVVRNPEMIQHELRKMEEDVSDRRDEVKQLQHSLKLHKKYLEDLRSFNATFAEPEDVLRRLIELSERAKEFQDKKKEIEAGLGQQNQALKRLHSQRTWIENKLENSKQDLATNEGHLRKARQMAQIAKEKAERDQTQKERDMEAGRHEIETLREQARALNDETLSVQNASEDYVRSGIAKTQQLLNLMKGYESYVMSMLVKLCDD